MLSLAEQLMLLALHDEKGSVLTSAMHLGLAGAIVLDLLFKKKVELQGGRIEILDDRPTGDSSLDHTLELIRQSKRARSPKYWVSKIPNKVRDLDVRVADQLVRKEIVRREGRRILWVFNIDRYPTANAAPESEIRHRIRNVVLHDHAAEDEEIALISLMKACGLVNEVFARPERRAARRKIKEVTEGEAVGQAVSAVVTEMTVAITTAVTAATVAATASN
ncbi:GPP34 family phosphoprotein [bacterium]|nr:GPP34 family phosphoprotein [bacterium]